MRTTPFHWAAILLAAAAAGASDLDEFKVKRQEVFEFSEKPSLKRKGDRVEIAFALQGNCDVTVAVDVKVTV